MSALSAVRSIVGRFAGEIGPFIAGPRPDNPVLGHYHDYTRWVCDSYANVAPWYGVAADTVGGAVAINEGFLREACRPYLGDDGLPVPDDPPFMGGQCPGVLYLVNVRTEGPSGSVCGDSVVRFTGSSPLWGPIEGIEPFGPVWCSGAFGSARRWAVIHAGGARTVVGPEAYSASIESVVRYDGQPDNCGNIRPDGPKTGPNAPADPGPNPPGGGQPPEYDPRGRWRFRPGPITSPYNEPDVPFPPIDPFDPTEDPDPGPDPDSPGEPDSPVDTDPDGDAEGQAPDGQEIASLQIELTTVPDGRALYAGGQHRGACWVYMGDADSLALHPDGALLLQTQRVYPAALRLTHWKVKANFGYTVRVTPYYRDIPED